MSRKPWETSFWYLLTTIPRAFLDLHWINGTQRVNRILSFLIVLTNHARVSASLNQHLQSRSPVRRPQDRLRERGGDCGRKTRHWAWWSCRRGDWAAAQRWRVSQTPDEATDGAWDPGIRIVEFRWWLIFWGTKKDKSSGRKKQRKTRAKWLESSHENRTKGQRTNNLSKTRIYLINIFPPLLFCSAKNENFFVLIQLILFSGT